MQWINYWMASVTWSSPNYVSSKLQNFIEIFNYLKSKFCLLSATVLLRLKFMRKPSLTLSQVLTHAITTNTKEKISQTRKTTAWRVLRMTGIIYSFWNNFWVRKKKTQFSFSAKPNTVQWNASNWRIWSKIMAMWFE